MKLGGGVTITPDSPVGQTLSDGSFMVYTYADSGVLADMLTEDDGVTLGLSDLPEGAVSYIPTANKETNYQESNNEAPHWGWLAGGVALAAVGIKAFDDSDNNVNTPTKGKVTITGTATEDQNLTANTSALNDGDGVGTFTYQWWANDGTNNLAIAGATDKTLTLTQAQVGKIITVVVTHTDAQGTVEPAITSAATVAVENVNDPTTGVVTIDGTPEENRTLIANTSALTDEDGKGTFTYQWWADDGTNNLAIAGATDNTLILTQEQVGKIITVVVIHTDALGTVEPAKTSTATAAVENVNDPTTGVVTITGTAREDQNLTADTSALMDDDGKGTFSYQWWADDGTDNLVIVNATSAALTLTQAHVGKTITLKVIHTDAFGNVESVITSAATAAVENVNDLTTGEVIITGTAREDKTLTANTSDLMDEDGLGAFSYQWQADGTDIMGATNSTFTLTQAQVGKTITVEVSYTDAFGTVEPVITSDPTVAVENVNDLPMGEVTITGAATATPKQGETLTAVSTVTDEDGLGTFSYQWQADDVAIANANNPTLTLTQAQVGKTITVVVSYTDGYETPETVTSDPTVAVENVNDLPMGEVTITGAATATPKQGETLTAVSTVTDEDGLGTFSYQWQADDVAIANANNSTLTLTQAQVGKTITVVVSYTDGYETPETVTSDPTVAVENVNDLPMGEVTITGAATATPKQGETLTAVPTVTDEDGLGTFTYQWWASGADGSNNEAISGANNPTLTLTQAQVGKTITVVVSYTDGYETPETVTSDPTVAVENVNDLPMGEVTITGAATATPKQGETLTAVSTVTDEDGLGTFSYQWQADDVAISGANNPTLTLTQAQVGKTITVVVSYTDGYRTPETVTSDPTVAVENVNDPTTGVVTIDGAATAAEDQTLIAVTSALRDEDGLGTFSYQWQADDVAIANANNSTLTLTQAQVGKTITVVVSYTDGYETPETVTSDPTVAVENVNDLPMGEVTITGAATATPKQGETLTAVSTVTDEDGLGTFSYQWQADGMAIANSNNPTFILTQDQVGKTITVVVSYTDDQGEDETVTSDPTDVVVNNNDVTITAVTDDVGSVMGAVNPAVRYILLKQTGASSNFLWLGEVEVFSGETNIALDEAVTVTVGETSNQSSNSSPAEVTNGIKGLNADGYISFESTSDNWVQIDLGAHYAIDRVEVYALRDVTSTIANIRNVDIFASNEDFSGKIDTDLIADPNAIKLGGTGDPAIYKTSLTTAINNTTDDNTPTLSGTLTTTLGEGEELAIYHGTTKLDGVATVNDDNTWTFILTNALTNGSYAFKAVIQTIGEDEIDNADVISAAYTIMVDAAAPTIMGADDNVATYDSVEGAIATGTTTDDTTPTLTGTLTAALTAGQVLAIYDGETKLGEADVATDNTWTYTPPVLTAGSYSFTAQVENGMDVLQGLVSAPYVVNINPGISMTVTDNVGAVMGDLNPAMRYILLKQTGEPNNQLGVGEVEVFSGGVNVALNKAVTAGYANLENSPPAAVTDGSRASDTGYSASTATTDNWLLIDLGANYVIDSVNAYASSTFLPPIKNVDIFASTTESFSRQSHADLIANVNVIRLGGTGPSPQQKNTVMPTVITIIDDNTPTLSGTLATALGAAEELAIYDGSTKLSVVTVDSNNVWTFTPTDPLADGNYELKAVIQAANNSDIANARVISTTSTITVNRNSATPTQTATITAVSDDVNTHGSVKGAIATGTTTDDTTPTLSGTLTAALTGDQVLAIYDGDTKLGEANEIVTDTSVSWTYIPSSALPAGSHSFTARVESSFAGQGMTSDAHVVNINPSISMTVTDNAGTTPEIVRPGVRYILLKQTGATIASQSEVSVGRQLIVGEVHVFSAGVNVAKDKTVTALGASFDQSPPSEVTDDSLEATSGYIAKGSTTDNWLLIDLGANYSIDSVDVYALSSSDEHRENIRNVDVFASREDLSSLPYTELQAAANAINLGGTGDPAIYKTSLTTAINNTTDDNTPTLSGTLAIALGTGEELAIYDGTDKLGVAMVDNSDNRWTFTPTNPLINGSYAFKAVIQAANNSDIANARVISITSTITVDTSSATPIQTPTITAVSDNVNTHGSIEGAIATGTTTDDTTPTLSGTLTAALTAGQVLAIYDGSRKLDDAAVTDTTWSYTPDALTAGSYSFTAQVESPTGGEGTASAAHVVNINPSISMIVIDNMDDDSVTGVINPAVRYILLKQTGDSTNQLVVGEVQVFSGGENVALGKTVTANITPNSSSSLLAVTNGAAQNAYQASALSDDNWLLIDLGTNYVIDRVDAYANFPNRTGGIKNVGIFASTQKDISTLSYAQLTAATSATYLGGTDATPEYKTSLTANVTTDDSTPTLRGTLAVPLGTGEELAIYDGTAKLGVATVDTANNSWEFTTSVLLDDSYTFKAVIQEENGIVGSERVISTASTITIDASAAAAGAAAAAEALYSSYASSLEASLEAKVEAKDPISGLSVKTYSLPSTAKDQTLDFPDEHTEINVVNIAGSGANTVKIQLDDVLQSGINLFNDANGWDGLDGTGKHQLVVNGDADDTLVLDTIAEAESWIKEGTTTNSDQTYLVYQFEQNNADGVSQVLQVLVDQDMIRDGAIL